MSRFSYYIVFLSIINNICSSILMFIQITTTNASPIDVFGTRIVLGASKKNSKLFFLLIFSAQYLVLSGDEMRVRS